MNLVLKRSMECKARYMRVTLDIRQNNISEFIIPSPDSPFKPQWEAGPPLRAEIPGAVLPSTPGIGRQARGKQVSGKG